MDNVEQCFLFGLLDEGEDTLFQLFQSLSATDDVVAAAIKDSTEANGAKVHESLIWMLCAFLNRHSLSSVVIVFCCIPHIMHRHCPRWKMWASITDTPSSAIRSACLFL